ncbi:MAG: hypothetical protein H2172_16235 [Opitutus sp.]|nr:hypothetical protein [Opitutus sp.]MCS6244631.1 hypothetical protein [Opitutus sp.]MCS6244648.1 hypothetical protein [Opitutus sp.]MCS6245381.1 hypothetical protein [Opitutus sp.]MCS6248188.1 hypothetical protein [Opitutus sp.]
MSVEVKVVTDEASQLLRGLTTTLGPGQRRPLMSVLGRTVEKEYREWFKIADAEKPNRRGWKRQHFWAQIRKATAFAFATDDSATVTIADPRIRTQVYGGTIRPKEKKFLAIPLRAEAYGVRPSSGLIEGLFPYRSKRGTLLLGREEGGKLVNFYKLVRSVTVKADPSALPPPALTSQAVLTAARSFVQRQR